MNHHVLLIGIDAYQSARPLTGCVNDIDAFQRLLIERVGIAPDRITRLAAPKAGGTHAGPLPTLAAIRAALTRLGNVADDGDRVLIYYSGHGTHCVVDDGRGRRFAREALIPVDGSGADLLFDWELNHLLARMSARTRDVTVILDCCAAAGATRGTWERTATDRFHPTLGVHRVADAVPAAVERGRGLGGELASVQRCQVIAACRDDERAQESRGDDGVCHGELTRALVQLLREREPEELQTLRWGRIWRRLAADVQRRNPAQTPWLSGNFGRPVFGSAGDGPDEDADPGYALVQVPGGYQLDAGTLAGVTEDAVIGVYGPTPPRFPLLDSPEDRAARIGTLRIAAAPGLSTSVGVAEGPLAPPPGARARLIRPGRAARLRVAVRALGPAAPVDPALLAQLPAELIELVADPRPGSVEAPPELFLVEQADRWVLADDVHGGGAVESEPVLTAIPKHHLAAARPLVRQYLAYVAPLRFARACQSLATMLEVWILDCRGARLSPAQAQHPDLRVLDKGSDGVFEAHHEGPICFVVGNHSGRALSVTLLDCAPSGRVNLLGERRLPARSQHVFWADDVLGEPFEVTVPPGRRFAVDRLVAIGTTLSDRSLAHLATDTSFDDALAGRITRGRMIPPGAEATELWTAATTCLRTRMTP